MRSRRREEERRREEAHGAAHGGQRAAMPAPSTHGAVRSAVWNGHDGQPPAIELEQQLYPQSVQNISGSTIGPGTVYQFKLNNTGLVRGLEVIMRGTITAGATSTQTRTPVGLANFLSQIVFQDFASYQRVSTTGWHLNLLQSAKERFSSQVALTGDSPNGFANNNPGTLNRTKIAGQQVASSISANGTSDFQVTYRIPFARDRFDLRGGIWAKKTGASAFVFLTLNPSMFVTSTQDFTNAVFQSGGSDLGTLSNFVIEVYEDYLDFFPRVGGPTGPEIVPWRDLEDAYLLTQTAASGLLQGQDNTVAFTDEREFLSVAAIYDNAGALNFGNDIGYWSVKSANLLPIFQRSAFRQLSVQRKIFHDDLPPGMYYFPFETRPINTQSFGNTNLVVNPSSVVGNTSQLLIGFEAFGRIGAVVRATALPSGA